MAYSEARKDDVEYFQLDEALFERIYREHWKQLYSIAYHYLEDEDLVFEIVQDLFTSLWQRRNRLKITGDIEHYLNRSVKLSVLHYLRDSKVRKSNLETAWNLIEQSGNETDERVHFQQLKSKIEDLVEALPPQCQTVYRLSREKGLLNNQISNHLGIAEKTVKNHLNHALGYLRIHLKEYL